MCCNLLVVQTTINRPVVQFKSNSTDSEDLGMEKLVFLTPFQLSYTLDSTKGLFGFTGEVGPFCRSEQLWITGRVLASFTSKYDGF